MIIKVTIRQAGKRDESVSLNPGQTVEAALEIVGRSADGLNIRVNGAEAGLGTELQADAEVVLYPKVVAG